MMSFFESVGSFFAMIGNFIANTIEGILTFITVTSMSLTLPPMLSGLIPPILYTAAVIFVGITVVRKIFGR